MNHPELKEFINKLPKAELHVHLEGATAPETVLKLAHRHKMEDSLPVQDVAGLQEWFRFTSFENFLKIYVTIQDLIRTPEDFALLAYDLGADMYRQNILYREVTLTPHTHIDFQDKGLSIQDILSGLEQGRQQARAEFSVEIRWVFDIYRNLAFTTNENGDSAPAGNYDPEPAEKTLFYAQAGLDYGVVGFGIGGNEIGAPAASFQHAFMAAKESGLLSVPHAGEVDGPESVWQSVRELQADRIGHGVRSIEDPELIDYLAEYHITLEVNPTSNLCLHVYDSIENHPFKALDDAGVILTINSDDPPLFNTTLEEEYYLIAEAFGYSKQDLVRFARNAFLAAGADLGTKQLLMEKFEARVATLT
jgi:aminodeoxyfutalosine deaminase